MTRKVMNVVNSATPIACSARITNIGNASAASSHRRRLISAMARNSDSETVPANESASPSISCSLASASPLRITAPTNSVHTNAGNVNVGFSASREIAAPSATHAAISMIVTVRRCGVNVPDDSAASCASASVLRHAERRAARLQPLDQALRHRTADEATHDQAERRRGERNAGRSGEAEGLGELLAPCRAGAVAAGHRHRAGDQSDQRIDAHRASRADADDVLHDQHADDAGGEEQQRDAAAREHARIGAEADRGEEREHQSGLQRRVEANAHAAEVQERDQRRGDQTADDRFGNRVLAQERDVLDQPPADDQHERGDGQRSRDTELPIHGCAKCSR